MNCKCENCGAPLEIDQIMQVKFCPYCGAKIEIPEETPANMTDVVHGIAKSFFIQHAEKVKYNHEHAAEIAEEKRKEKREERQNDRKMMLYMMGGLCAMMVVSMLVGKVIGWF